MRAAGPYTSTGRPQPPGPAPAAGYGFTGLTSPENNAGAYGYRTPPLRDRPQVQGQRGAPLTGASLSGAAPAEVPRVAGQVIKQRDTALPQRAEGGAARPVAAIAPDGLDSFARDLRALRAKAELDYPEIAERSHYTMKTLASAAGGLRLPTLPVTMAYVRACGGDIGEWEDRWHKLAEKFGTAPEAEAPDQSEEPEPPAATPGPDGEQSKEVFVITSAKPRQPGW